MIKKKTQREIIRRNQERELNQLPALWSVGVARRAFRVLLLAVMVFRRAIFSSRVLTVVRSLLYPSISAFKLTIFSVVLNPVFIVTVDNSLDILRARNVRCCDNWNFSLSRIVSICWKITLQVFHAAGNKIKIRSTFILQLYTRETTKSFPNNNIIV